MDTPDIRFEGHGSVTLIRPITEAGNGWVSKNVHAEDWQLWGGAIAAEPRRAHDVLAGARDAGLTVE